MCWSRSMSTTASRKWLNGFAKPWGLLVDYVDMSNLDA